MTDLAHARVDVHVNRHMPLRRIWRYVGYDEPNYTYTPNGRELLGKLGRLADAPYYVRCHFLLCSGDGTGRLKWGSTNVYTEDEAGKPVYDWTLIDRILDTYLETGHVPFVEIGFMPQALSTAPEGVRYDDPRHGGWRYPPRDMGRWLELVRNLAEHCLARYGMAEVSRWYWELWNEPDIFYWTGGVEEYCRLYDYTEAGLHAALPQALLGGPATTSGMERPESSAFLRAFLEHCTRGVNAVSGRRGTRLDYISFHAKGGGYTANAGAAKLTPTLYTLTGNVAAGLEVIADFPELRGLEVVLSECDPDGWAAGAIRDNPNLFYRNTEYYASYVAGAACKLIDLRAANDSGAAVRVDAMLTWAFQFENEEFFAGLRTLSTNGVDKPVLNVFRLLARLGGMRLHLASSAGRDPRQHPGGDTADAPPDVCGIAAVDGTGRIQVLLCSHHDDWDVTTHTAVETALSGIPAGARYAVSATVVDATHSNAHTAWVEMGRPQSPDAGQLAALLNAARLETESLGEWSATDRPLSLEMAAHSVCLLEYTPL